MRVGRKLRLSPGEYHTSFVRSRVMRHDPLNMRLRNQFRPDDSDLMNEKVHASRVSHNIFVISGITRDSDDTPVIFDSVPVRGLDGIAVVDLECDDSQPIAFVNGAVDGKFLDRDL